MKKTLIISMILMTCYQSFASGDGPENSSVIRTEACKLVSPYRSYLDVDAISKAATLCDGEKSVQDLEKMSNLIDELASATSKLLNSQYNQLSIAERDHLRKTKWDLFDLAELATQMRMKKL